MNKNELRIKIFNKFRDPYHPVRNTWRAATRRAHNSAESFNISYPGAGSKSGQHFELMANEIKCFKKHGILN